MSFVGRKHELKKLKTLTQRNIANLVVIKGRRRIGKSRLIAELGSQYKHYYVFSGLYPGALLGKQEQMKEFSLAMSRQFNIPSAKYNDWSDIFWMLHEQTKNKKALILFDEISWMASEDDEFLAKLKNAWDLYFSQNSKLTLVLCGSVSAWINENILASSGYFGRISLVLSLKELPLIDCNDFWGPQSKHISAYEKIKMLSVTGGVPRYLEEINPSLSAEENIQQMCFDASGLLYNDFEQIFTKILRTKSVVYEKVVMALVTGAMDQSELTKKIGTESGGALTRYLDEMMEAGFISRDYTWNIKDGKISLLSKYRLSDNYLRFYLKYVFPNKQKIENGNFDQKSLSSLSGWKSIMGLQVENLVLKNKNKIKEILGIKNNEVVFDNAYFQRPTKRRKGCQIDYLIQTESNVLYLCEIKYKRDLIGKGIIKEIEDKISRFVVPKGFSIRPVLIHVNGVHEDVEDERYFSVIIDMAEMFF